MIRDDACHLSRAVTAFMGQHGAQVRVGTGCPPYSTAFTIDSITFFASPNTIIVFGM
jgi:hypothetical protein